MRRARHVEVQLLGDTHGNLVHLFERDCTIQRRNQKVIERAPGALSRRGDARSACATPRSRSAAPTHYVGAGTVEFLMDADTGDFYFIEVNPRIQVEHTVTEQVTGLDIVKAQIRILEGGRLGRIERPGFRRRRGSASTATRCNAGSPPRIPTTISFPTTAASPPIAAPSASASASMAAPPIRARSSRASTTRCWRR